jgi:hypothetical protein
LRPPAEIEHYVAMNGETFEPGRGIEGEACSLPLHSHLFEPGRGIEPLTYSLRVTNAPTVSHNTD